MPLQNRVTPFGEIISHPARGQLMGNRGILHDAGQRLSPSRWRHRHWVTCLTRFKGWHREVMQPHAYTELFFLDEATALAAGHRPCALCRRERYRSFQTAVQRAFQLGDQLDADGLDRMLHQARIMSGSRRQQRFAAELESLPTGTMVSFSAEAAAAWLVRDDRLLRWQPAGYDDCRTREKGVMVEVLTPGPTVLALKNGYHAMMHGSADV